LKLNALRGATALAVIASITASALCHAPASSAAAAPAPVQLSNETTFARWAYAVAPGNAYSAPTATAHRVGRLRFRTEDGFPEVYVVLANVIDARGTAWIHVRLPQPPNNVTGWVLRSTLGDLHIVHTKLVVNRRTLRVRLYEHGHQVFEARGGGGQPGTPTPAGAVWVRVKLRGAGRAR
jgi:hypothetical protein